MTLKQAYIILRKFQDWRTGKDCRLVTLKVSEISTAINIILKSQGLGEPFADCENCKHATFTWADFMDCKLKKCKFERIVE